MTNTLCGVSHKVLGRKKKSDRSQGKKEIKSTESVKIQWVNRKILGQQKRRKLGGWAYKKQGSRISI